MSIEEINIWLENAAQLAEKEIEDNPHLKGSTWPQYYRDLIDFDKKEKFSISSCDFVGYIGKPKRTFPVIEYIRENNLPYEAIGYTGYCEYIRMHQE